MAKNSPSSGNDAASITPRFVPDYELQGRDDSGGPEFTPYTAAFGDGGYVTGQKRHLSASGGTNDSLDGDMQSDDLRTLPAQKALGQSNVDSPAPPRKSVGSQSQNKS